MIPAFNEERTLPWVLGGLKRSLPRAEVLVISDGSTDGGAALARRFGARVLEFRRRQGYGEAVRRGFQEAGRRKASCLLQMDADGQHDPASLTALAAGLGRGADIVIGSRFLHPGSYRPPWVRRGGMAFFSLLTRMLTGLSISDPTSGMRAFSLRAVRHFAEDGFRSPFHDADVLVRAHRAGLRIVEVPARMRAAPRGRSMHRGPAAFFYGFRMLWSLARALTRPLP